ncbi:hypothetical protein B0T25DRAFT_212341 [Lasiosphaeria hispida]|uniref:Uncharacterized protein n=1 Tax=Lasiosphaeria hispida TaxID=260671 RepID=A0AAJ0MEG3_9PEZI|nr:hypothetical protein B0T25DRAFT_212341 [Lasiosphaeria hispida]
MAPKGPFRLATVNTAPDRARRLIGIVVEDMASRFTIIYAGNAESIEEVQSVVEELKPDLLLTASMWTPEEATEIISIAKGVVPDLKTFSLPQGLQAQGGPDAVVDYILKHLPALLN